MIILASKSERRIELLKSNNINFKTISSNVVEKIDNNLSPSTNALNLAKTKALDVFNKNKEYTVIGADTIVVLNNEIIGKPKNIDDAFKILSKLNNNTHYVITGVFIISNKKEVSFYEKTMVTFKKLEYEEIKKYIETKEPFGKAGAYAIQGIGNKLIKSYHGDYNNIVGLPIKKVLNKLSEF